MICCSRFCFTIRSIAGHRNRRFPNRPSEVRDLPPARVPNHQVITTTYMPPTPTPHPLTHTRTSDGALVSIDPVSWRQDKTFTLIRDLNFGFAYNGSAGHLGWGFSAGTLPKWSWLAQLSRGGAPATTVAHHSLLSCRSTKAHIHLN